MGNVFFLKESQLFRTCLKGIADDVAKTQVANINPATTSNNLQYKLNVGVLYGLTTVKAL